MPTIEVTEEQLDRLEAVRDDVAETLAGPYGHTRVQDAVEYLLDTYTPPAEGATPDTDDGAESTTDDATTESAESTDGGLASLEPIGSAKAAALERAGYETLDDLREASVGELTEISGVGETLAERILDAVSGATDETGEADADADESAGDQGDDGTNRLDAMMNLLNEHDDKWYESDGDEPYEVELPDGSVETARTKDDIRGILFRHY